MKKLRVSNSYGIICCKKNNNTNKNEILFIKKKNTYAYINFLKGLYSSDYDILSLLNKMTFEEKITIMSLDFKLSWYKCFLSYDDNDKKIIKFKNKFNKIVCKDGGKKIVDLIKQSSNYDLIYEIPKGHVNKHESHINAAIREFQEETNIHKSKYRLLVDEKPLIYTFVDENVKYIYHYYIAIMLDQSYIPKVNYSNKHMLFETCDIRFLETNFIHIINNDSKFLSMIKSVNKIVKKYKKIN